jgi:hypothetical protein
MVFVRVGELDAVAVELAKAVKVALGTGEGVRVAEPGACVGVPVWVGVRVADGAPGTPAVAVEVGRPGDNMAVALGIWNWCALGSAGLPREALSSQSGMAPGNTGSRNKQAVITGLANALFKDSSSFWEQK